MRLAFTMPERTAGRRVVSKPQDAFSASCPGLDDYCGAVREDLGHAGRHLVGVVAHRDDRIGAERGGVLPHEVEGLLARPFAELRVERDLAAEERLDRGAERGEDIARAHRDAADDAAIGCDAVPLELETGGDALWGNGHRG